MDASVVVRDDTAGDGEPKTIVSIVLARFIRAEKAFKQALTRFFRNRISGVGNGQVELFRLNLGADNDFSAIRRVTDRII